MPLSNRLRIWTPRILAVLFIYLAYVWAYEATAQCLTDGGVARVCTAQDANSAIFRGLGAALPTVLTAS